MAAFSGPFWLSVFCASFAPTAVGYQDLSGLLARPPDMAEHGREHLIASPFGTIHAATFSFSRPIGTAVPEPLAAQPVNFDPRSLDVKVWSTTVPPTMRPAVQVEYPGVNRRLKGDRMPLPQSAPAASDQQSLPPLQPITAPSPAPANPPAPSATPRPKSAEQIGPQAPAPELDMADAFGSVTSVEGQKREIADPPASSPAATADAEADNEDGIPSGDRPPEVPDAAENAATSFASLSFIDEDPAERETQLFFGVGNTAASGTKLQQWAPGAEPILVSPSPPAIDPDVKVSALEGAANAGTEGETLADKGDVSRIQTPAERLGLSGRSRAKAEKCLADAVYFEARGEPLKGQEAVAQVVMNRVFSGFYPDNVCGVVYQNANRHLACQFTFACEGKDLSRIDEPDMWEQAKRIAKDTLDGKIWLADVGHATHYHAYWVHPSWVHEMKKMYSLGVHTFYRPRAWSDSNADAPVWTTAPAPSRPPGAGGDDSTGGKDHAAGTKSTETAKGPQAAASPDPAARKIHG